MSVNATILSLATATPPYRYTQDELAEQLISIFSLDKRQAERVRKLHTHSKIKYRYSVLEDFKKDRSNWTFFKKDYPKTTPKTSERNQEYKHYAPKLAHQAAYQAINNWKEDPQKITHVISVSCTGAIAPGLEFYLMQSLSLRENVQRFGINFMGCYGAIKGLALAQAFAKESPDNRILLVCTELCSLHINHASTMEAWVINSLFSDGAGAAIIGCHPHRNEETLWEISKFSSLGLENSLDKMSWEISDEGFLMHLSPKVPEAFVTNSTRFFSSLKNPLLPFSNYDFAIHPGGKAILEAIEKAENLNEMQTTASWNTLENYGNMSSATLLFILDALRNQPNQQPWCFGLAFGPGLSMEGILLKNSRHV